jgi:hypothetical protein
MTHDFSAKHVSAPFRCRGYARNGPPAKAGAPSIANHPPSPDSLKLMCRFIHFEAASDE